MIPIDLDIDMLRCFVEVARTGSFTRTGKNIGLTQSGVSVKIRRLEERVNSRIFDRRGKHLGLTVEGELLLDYAGRILSIHDEAVSRLTQPEATGKLRVGLIDYFLPDLLPRLLSSFRKRYPNISLEVQTGFGMHLIPMYQQGELDLVVTGKDSYTGDCRVLLQEPLVWVMGRDSDISMLPDPVHLVALPSPCLFRKFATDGLERVGLKWEVLFTGTSIANIQAAVEAGMGLSILPQGAMNEGLRRVPSQFQLPELPLYSIVLLTDERVKNDARDVFVSYLEAELDAIR